MKYSIKNLMKHSLAVIAMAMVMVSCNKDLPEATPTNQAYPPGNTAAQLLSDPNYSTFIAAVTKAGLLDVLTNADGRYTIFAPNNAAFTASGIPAEAIAMLPAEQLRSILQYHIIGGQTLRAANFSEKFPNNYYQSMLMLQEPNAAIPMGYRMPIFISRTGNTLYANNIPVTQTDIVGSNAVIHRVARIIAPPQTTLWGFLDTASNFEYLKAAVLRADSGNATAGTRLQDYLALGAANFTLFAPSDEVFQATLYNLVYPRVYQQTYGAVYAAQIAAGAPEAMATAAATAYADANAPLATQQMVGTPEVFNNPALQSTLTATLVKGLVSYHLLGNRAFVANFPAGESAYPSVAGAVLPNVSVNKTATGLQVRGPGNVVEAAPGMIVPYYADVVSGDRHFVNGVLHVVNRILLPMQL